MKRASPSSHSDPRRLEWDRRYGDASREVHSPDPLVVEATTIARKDSALDIACGTGRNTLALARAGFRTTAIDYSLSALSSLRMAASAQNLLIDLVAADLTKPCFDNHVSFDLICDCRYLDRALFPQMKRWLAPGGLLVMLIAMEDDDATVPRMHAAYLARPGELRDEFSDLKIVRYSEDKPAPGKRRMAGLLARK